MSSGKIDRNAKFNEDTQTQMLAVLYEKQLEQKNAIRGVAIDGKTFWRLNDIIKVSGDGKTSEQQAIEEFFPALKEADLFGNWATMSQDLIDIVFSIRTGGEILTWLALKCYPDEVLLAGDDMDLLLVKSN